MELKNRKYINNTKSLPGFELGKLAIPEIPGLPIQQPNIQGPQITDLMMKDLSGKINAEKAARVTTKPDIAGGIMNAASTTLNAAGTIANSFKYDKTSEDMNVEAGTSQHNVDGFGYETQNIANENQIRSDFKKKRTSNTIASLGAGAAAGAAIGTVIPVVGTGIGALAGGVIGLIGGLLGGRSAKRKMEEELRKQRLRAVANNDYNRSGAFTQSMQHRLAEEYGSQESQYMWGAKFGKDRGQIFTGIGKRNGQLNSWVSKGEYIWDGQHSPKYVNEGPNDTAKAYLRGKDTVFSDSLPGPMGGSIADNVPFAAATGQLNQLADYLKMLHLKGYKCGKDKLPGYYGGKISGVDNYISSGIGMLTGLNQYFDAKNNAPYKPNTYAANQYEGVGLNTLDNLKVNPYPIVNQLRNAEARTNYAINNSGGLSGGQRMLARVAGLNDTQTNIAKSMADTQIQNNAYRQQYAQSALNIGAQNAQRRQQANQYDLDYYTKAHAAQLQGKQMGIYNFLNSMQQGMANEFKRKQFNNMYDLYVQDMKNKQNPLDTTIDNTKKVGTSNISKVKGIKEKTPSVKFDVNSLLPSQDELTKKLKPKSKKRKGLVSFELPTITSIDNSGPYGFTYKPFNQYGYNPILTY